MRKFTVGLFALLLIAMIYYFTLGQAQLIAEVKKQVNIQLVLLEKEGFKISNREIKDKKEYFEISLSNTQKATHFLQNRGINITHTELKKLKGSQLGIALNYLPDSYTSIALDIIPLSLPTHLINEIQGLQELLQKKAIQIHVNVNKLGTAFKGYLRDINETIHTNKKMHIQVRSFHFTGDIDKQTFTRLTQSLDTLIVSIPQEFKLTLNTLISTYHYHNDMAYTHTYHLKSLVMQTENDSIKLKEMAVDTNTSIRNHLASIVAKSHTEKIELSFHTSHYTLEDTNITSILNQLDISALETLQTTELNDKETIRALVAKLLSKGVALHLPHCSVGHISFNKKRLTGFTINAEMTIDKNMPITHIEKNLMNSLPYIDANLKIALSLELFQHFSKDPAMMLASIMFPPKNNNQEKIYHLKLKEGKVYLNAKPLM